ncbi:PaaI family thioesterase [Haladaptatus salinisoli]|uniref:PaaI family thioesterase n=1 Tax=Haladaptatus salinisoli TaxID=2884876 RepID=UPI001D0A6AC0|nr:PaaI family thioesterase [Haladaptatus salinisoli]
MTEPESFQAFIDAHGYLSWLDLRVETVEEGYLEMRIPYDEKLLNPVGNPKTIHGGIAATLVDTASGFVLRTVFDDPANARLATTDLNVSYLRPASDDLLAEATVVRAGNSMGVVEVTVRTTDADGEPTEAVVGRSSYRLFR